MNKIIIILVGAILTAFLIDTLIINQDLNKSYEESLAKNTELEIALADSETEITELQNELRTTNKLLAETAEELEQSKVNQLETGLQLNYVGEYTCTAYCCEKYPHICGTGSGKTASGAPATPDVTVAVTDLQTFPYGTVIYIEDVGVRVVQDTGNFGKSKIDVAVDTHKHATNWEGQGKHKVYIIKFGGETE